MKTIQVLVSGLLVICLFHAAGATPIRVGSSDALAIRGSPTDTPLYNGGFTAEPEDLDEENLSHLLSQAETATSLDKLPKLVQLNDPIHALDSAARLYGNQLREHKRNGSLTQGVGNELNRRYNELTSTHNEIRKLISAVLQRLDTMKGGSSDQEKISEAIKQWTTAETKFLVGRSYQKPT
ncbi:hypothetical protein H0H93_011091 [Arthromyces matolae]|nr:hypothetical protein H0H93_011091 [Arthromyces matolae]